ncbi:hypothetical protein [Paraburkholderia bannensis]|uniref:hypothetical protein n=1 Tax=Paraburkholderia bannensis TaxID=765414 RepID=UPI00048061E0|nr:hypothetical protein [Paraburkholderia bannensis]
MPKLDPPYDPANPLPLGDDKAEGAQANRDFGFPRLSGPGASVSLSVAVFLVVLAAGVSYDHAHRLRTQQTGALDMADGGAVLNGVHAPSPSIMAGLASSTSRVLLAQARDCARAGRWDCVDEATHAALALDEGEQLAPAMQPPGGRNVTPAPLLAAGPANSAKNAYRNGTTKVAVHSHGKHHNNHRLYASRNGRGSAANTQRASPEFLADLYRH